MAATAVVQLLGPATSLWVDANSKRVLIIGDPALGPNHEVSIMQYADVIIFPEGFSPTQDLRVRTKIVGDPAAGVHQLQYEVDNTNNPTGTFFSRTAILASRAATP